MASAYPQRYQARQPISWHYFPCFNGSSCSIHWWVDRTAGWLCLTHAWVGCCSPHHPVGWWHSSSTCHKESSWLGPVFAGSLQHVRHTLRDYGFTLNFSKGKTSAVMTLKGARSGELRKQYQLHANPGVTAPLKMGKLMHFVPTYQHLGTLLHLTMHYIVNCDLGLVWPSRHLPNWLSQFWPTSLCLANYGCNFSNLLLLPSCILVSGLGQHQPRNKSNTCKGHWLQCLRECCVLVRSVSRLIGFWCLQILRRIELDLQWKGYYMRRDYSVRVRPFYTICYRLNLPKLNTLGCMGCELTLHGWKKPAPNVYLAR